MSVPPGNSLIVEGIEDLYAIAELMGQHVRWGKAAHERPVDITQRGGVTKLLKRSNITAAVKADDVRNIGFIVDADDAPDGRWQSLRDACKDLFPEIPDTCPSTGLIVDDGAGKRLGIWIMPNNISQGMLETFLGHLIPDDPNEIWKHAHEVVASAVNKGAPCKECHHDKASIHTWLAWQDPPGMPFGTAILESVLNAKSPAAEAFVTWFVDLFQLERVSSVAP